MNKKISRLISILLCSVLLGGTVSAASTPKEIDLYVSVNADVGGDGSKAHPFSTIEEAKAYVATINKNMSCDININISGGDYRLTEPLVFTDADSATNGYYINYRSVSGETVRILGSKSVTGWKKDGALLSAPFEKEYVRTLFVNNQRATRATNETPYVVGELYQDADETYLFDGIVADQKFSEYTNQSDIQLHFALSWISSLNNVESIIPHPENPEQSVFLMKQPEFDRRANYGLPVRKNIKFHVENAFEELDTEGEFYYNRQEKKLYYKPRSGETPETIQAEVPVLEEILLLNGSSSLKRVKNLSFTGLEFAYSAYERPSKYGLELKQANQLYNENEFDEFETTPAAIQFNWAEKIRFTQNVVRGMESVGIGFYQGVRLSNLTGNVFEDISDSAITVGVPSQTADSAVTDFKNLAASKKATSSGHDDNFGPQNAVDDTGAGWSGKGAPMWWQVDLGEAYPIRKIEIDPRSYLDQPVTRTNYQILGSNDPSFKEFSVLASQGSTPADLHKTAEYYTEDEDPYRYVRIQKTDGGYLYLQEVRIFDEESPFEAARETCKNNVISNNYLTGIGIENWSAPAICAYYVNNLSIIHNEIEKTAYSGISIGWGWASNPGSTVCRDNVVSYNYIHDHALRCFDAGGIYTLGQQPNTVEEGNYILDQGNHLAGLYSDNGTKHYTIKNNVTENTGYATFINSGSGDLVHQNNYTSDLFRYSPADSLYEEPIYFIPGNPSLEAVSIMKNAGLESSYLDIKQKSVSDWIVTDEQKLANAAGIADSEVPTLSVNSYASQYIMFMLDAAEKYLPLAEVGDGICQYPQSAIDDYRAAIETARNALRAADLTADKVTEIKIAFDKAYKTFTNSSNMMDDKSLISYAKKLMDSYKVGDSIGNITKKSYDALKAVVKEYEEKPTPYSRLDKQWLQRYLKKFQNDVIHLDIKALTLDGQLAPTVIDEENSTITVIVKYGSDRRALAPEISYHEDVNITPSNGSRVNFNEPVTYRLTTKDGQSAKEYRVIVNYPEKIDGYYNMKPAIEDKMAWNITGTTENSYYKNLIFGDSDLEFDMHCENIGGQWVGLAFRNQNFNMSFEEKGNDCYVVVFTGSVIELHRFNSGVRTQFYGDVDGVEKICGASIKSDVFRFGEKNRIKLSTVNQDDGVLIKLSVNGKEIFEVFDNYEGAITQPGYFGTVTSRPLVTLSAE